MTLFGGLVLLVWTTIMFVMMASTGDGTAGGIGLALAAVGWLAWADESFGGEGR